MASIPKAKNTYRNEAAWDAARSQAQGRFEAETNPAKKAALREQLAVIRGSKGNYSAANDAVVSPTVTSSQPTGFANEAAWNAARSQAQGRFEAETNPAKKAALRVTLDGIRAKKGQYGAPVSPTAPTTTDPATTTTTDPATGTTTTQDPNAFTFSEEDRKRLAPTLGMNYTDWLATTNGAYDTTNKLAQDELSRRLSANGQLGGGNELKQAADTSNQVSAAFVDKFNNARQNDINNFTNWYSTNANLTQQEKESLRSTWLGAAGLAANQSNTAAALAATQQGASATTANGNNTAGNIMSGATGGGGGGTAPTINNTNSSMADLYKILGNGTQQGFWGNLGKNLWGA